MRTRALTLGLLLLPGCIEEVPGEAIGAFDVTETLVENQCGAMGLPVLSTFRFAVELRNDGGRAVWRRKGAPLYFGTVQNGEYAFVSETSVAVRLDEPGGTEPPDWSDFVMDAGAANGENTCILIRREQITVRPSKVGEIPDGGSDAETTDAGASDDAAVDAGSPDGSAPEMTADGGVDDGTDLDLTGTHRIEVLPVAGTNCAPLLKVNGGVFDALPCAARYTMTGKARDGL